MALPTNPETEKIANKMPTVDMPISNFFVRYNAKNGKSMNPPKRSMNTMML
jgi:hypothetical protein